MEDNPYSILLKRIRSGEYRPGEMLAPERSLATDLGVNRRTVHRAVDRLIDAGLIVREPGRRPVIAAHPPIPTGPPTIALLMGNEPMYHAFQVVLRGCEPVTRNAGYRIVFMDTWGPTMEASRLREQDALDSLLEHPVEGVIIWCQSPETSGKQLELLSRQGTPCVLIDREVPGFSADFVGIDNIEAARCAVSHLLALRHRRIGFARGDDYTSPVQDRETGYRETLADHGIAIDESQVFCIPSTDSEARETVAALVERPNRPTAIFSVNDILALRLTRYVHELGLRVPEDIAIVGLDDVESQTVHEPFLTTLRQPYEAIGRHAARQIIQRIAAPDAPIRHVLLETVMVHRRSTVPAPSDSLTARGTRPVHPLSRQWRVAPAIVTSTE